MSGFHVKWNKLCMLLNMYRAVSPTDECLQPGRDGLQHYVPFSTVGLICIVHCIPMLENNCNHFHFCSWLYVKGQRNMWGKGNTFRGNDSDKFTVVVSTRMMGRWCFTNWIMFSCKLTTFENTGFVLKVGENGKWLQLIGFWFSFCSCFIPLFDRSPRLPLCSQDLSDVRAQSKEADSTLQMDWACSELLHW